MTPSASNDRCPRAHLQCTSTCPLPKLSFTSLVLLVLSAVLAHELLMCITEHVYFIFHAQARERACAAQQDIMFASCHATKEHVTCHLISISRVPKPNACQGRRHSSCTACRRGAWSPIAHKSGSRTSCVPCSECVSCIASRTSSDRMQPSHFPYRTSPITLHVQHKSTSSRIRESSEW